MIKEFYIEKTSIVHDLNFWTKFLCFLLIIPLSAFIATPLALLSLVVVFVLLVNLSKIPLRTFWNRTKLYNISISIAIILIALGFSEGNVLERLIRGSVLSIRFIILIGLGVLFAMVTNPIEIPLGLLQVRIPHRYGITLMVAFRMFPLISQKVSSVIQMQQARGSRLALNNFPKLVPHIIPLMVSIVRLTLETSINLSDTLLSRGYNPYGTITIPPRSVTKLDYYLFFVSGSILILIILQIL